MVKDLRVPLNYCLRVIFRTVIRSGCFHFKQTFHGTLVHVLLLLHVLLILHCLTIKIVTATKHKQIYRKRVILFTALGYTQQ